MDMAIDKLHVDMFKKLKEWQGILSPVTSWVMPATRSSFLPRGTSIRLVALDLVPKGPIGRHPSIQVIRLGRAAEPSTCVVLLLAGTLVNDIKASRCGPFRIDSSH